MSEHLHIEDPRSHSSEAVQRLRQVLAYGTGRPRADAKRPHFFEIEDNAEVFYIHVSPITGRVTLLATWSHVPVSKQGPTDDAVSACESPSVGTNSNACGY